jgi:hypothetical protein
MGGHCALKKNWSYFFNPAGQFNTTVIGTTDGAAGVGIRKRPSLVTS